MCEANSSAYGSWSWPTPRRPPRPARSPPTSSAPERLVARGELPVGGPDLAARHPAAARAAAPGARQAAPAGPLRYEIGTALTANHGHAAMMASTGCSPSGSPCSACVTSSRPSAGRPGPRPLAVPRGRAPVAARVRRGAPPGAIQSQGACLQRLPAQGGVHRLRPRARDRPAAGPVAAFGGRRFHRGISLLMVVLGLLIVAVEAARHHAASELALLGALLVASALARTLAGARPACPSGQLPGSEPLAGAEDGGHGRRRAPGRLDGCHEALGGPHRALARPPPCPAGAAHAAPCRRGDLEAAVAQLQAFWEPRGRRTSSRGAALPPGPAAADANWREATARVRDIACADPPRGGPPLAGWGRGRRGGCARVRAIAARSRPFRGTPSLRPARDAAARVRSGASRGGGRAHRGGRALGAPSKPADMNPARPVRGGQKLPLVVK